MTFIETKHGIRMFYSDEAKKIPELMDKAENGHAKGFVANGKTFTVQEGYTPSAAIRSFVDGSDATVCECEGALHSVIYNALLDVYGAPLSTSCSRICGWA